MGKHSEPKKKRTLDVSDYEKQIEKLERQLKRVNAENKNLKEMMRDTDEYLVQISEDKTLEAIFQEIKEKTNVKISRTCPKCQSEHMKQINLGIIKLIACTKCDYRNRLNEQGTSAT